MFVIEASGRLVEASGRRKGIIYRLKGYDAFYTRFCACIAGFVNTVYKQTFRTDPNRIYPQIVLIDRI